MDSLVDEFLDILEGYDSDDDAEALELVPRPVYRQSCTRSSNTQWKTEEHQRNGLEIISRQLELQLRRL